MSPQISPRDRESLSAYLDHELDPHARTLFDRRLHNEPDLRAELEALRQTRALLLRAPRYKTPRNFTLTRAMAGQVMAPGYPLARLSFSIASILFLVSLAGNYLGGQIGLPAASAPAPVGLDAPSASEPDQEITRQEEPPAEQPVEEQSLAIESAAIEESSDTAGQPTTSQAGAAGESPTESQPSIPLPAATEAPTGIPTHLTPTTSGEQSIQDYEDATPGLSLDNAGATPSATPTATATATATSTATPTGTGTATPTGAPTNLPPTEAPALKTQPETEPPAVAAANADQGDSGAAEAEAQGDSAAVQGGSSTSNVIWLVAAGAFGSISLAAGMIALILRKQFR